MADETAGDVDTTMKNLFMDSIQSPISNKGDGRELRVTQRMFQYQKEGDTNPPVRNEFKYCDDELKSMENPSLERGCTLAPILEPRTPVSTELELVVNINTNTELTPQPPSKTIIAEVEESEQ